MSREAAMKQFILVAGVDYYFAAAGYPDRCLNRMKRLIKSAGPKENLTFHIFDFPHGQVTKHEVGFSGGKPVIKTTKVASFKGISKANYYTTVVEGKIHYHFKPGQRDTMSILDVYKAVQKIGVDAPNTLAELSFFSHGYFGGPILVNSDDRSDAALSGRDPDDMDGRVSKDFISPTMDSTDLRNFQKAFRADGIVWIWGCAFPKETHQLLLKIEQRPPYKERGLDDNAVFRFKNLDSEMASNMEGWLQDVMGGPFPNKKDIEIKFKFLKYLFCRQTQASYAYHIAQSAKVITYGALLGTWAEGAEPEPSPLMAVPQHKGLVGHLKFYKNYLGFDFDPEGRHYGKYKPDFTCKKPSP